MRFGNWKFGGRNIVAIFAIAALLFSSIVVQAHVHPQLAAFTDHLAVGAASASDAGPSDFASDDARQVPASPSRKAGGADCYLCQAALGVNATLSTPASLLIHFSSVLDRAHTGPARLPVKALRSHAWQSRAPPLFS